MPSDAQALEAVARARLSSRQRHWLRHLADSGDLSSAFFYGLAGDRTAISLLRRGLVAMINVLADGTDYERVRLTPAGRAMLSAHAAQDDERGA